MTEQTLNNRALTRIRAVVGAKKLSTTAVASMWNQSIDMATRRLNGKVELKLSEIEAFARNTGFEPIDFLSEDFDLSKLEATA